MKDEMADAHAGDLGITTALVGQVGQVGQIQIAFPLAKRTQAG